MYFKEKASKVFPLAVWTGGGPIHASLAFSGSLPLPFDKPRMVLKALTDNHFGAFMQRVFLKACPGMEWLMSSEEFEDLVMVDFYRLLQGKSTATTANRLKNPNTGNYFHRITLLESESMVGGVRVWLTQMGDSEIQIGFRWRLEEQQEESEKVRKNVQLKAESQVEEVMEIKEFVQTEEKAKALEFEDFIKT